MDYFKLIRTWFDFAFENPEKIKPNHIALYTFCVEHCNRLGWKPKFGLPTEMAKEAIGIRSYNTYIKTLNDLIDFGFINIIERSKNQYSSNIIALSYYDKALDRALDKASVKHVTKQSESTVQSISSIIRHITSIPIYKYTNIQKSEILDYFSDIEIKEESIENIYNLYPSKCSMNNSSTGKSAKNREQIKKLLKTISEQKLKYIVKSYIEDCKKNNRFIKNFKTFLNDPPEYKEIELDKKCMWKCRGDTDPMKGKYSQYKIELKRMGKDNIEFIGFE